MADKTNELITQKTANEYVLSILDVLEKCFTRKIEEASQLASDPLPFDDTNIFAIRAATFAEARADINAMKNACRMANESRI